MMSSSREKLGLALGLAGMLLFGGTLPATRIAVSAFDPVFLSAIRAAIAGCCGATMLLVFGRPPPPRTAWPAFALAGLCTIVGFPVFMALAMAHVPASHGGVVLGILPLATAAAAALVAHERPSLGFWLASSAGAIIVLVFMIRQSGANTIQLGDIYLLCMVASGGLGYALSGQLSMTRPGWEVISWQVLLFLPLTAAATFALWPASLPALASPAWLGLAYVSFVSMFLAFFVFNAGMALAGVARVGQLMLLQPFVVVALSLPVNGEHFEPSTVLFAAAVVVAVIAGQRMQVRRR